MKKLFKITLHYFILAAGLFPTKRQWKSWSLPSRLTAIGTFLGCVSLIIAIIGLIHSNLNSNQDQIDKQLCIRPPKKILDAYPLEKEKLSKIKNILLDEQYDNVYNEVKNEFKGDFHDFEVLDYYLCLEYKNSRIPEEEYSFYLEEIFAEIKIDHAKKVNQLSTSIDKLKQKITLLESNDKNEEEERKLKDKLKHTETIFAALIAKEQKTTERCKRSLELDYDWNDDGLEEFICNERGTATLDVYAAFSIVDSKLVKIYSGLLPEEINT